MKGKPKRTKDDYNLMGEEKITIGKRFLETENEADAGDFIIKSRKEFDLFDKPLKQRRTPSSAVSYNSNGVHSDRSFHDKFWKADNVLGCSPLTTPPSTHRMMMEMFHMKSYAPLESIIMRIFDEIEAVSYAPEEKATPFDETSDLFLRRKDFDSLKHAWGYPARTPTLTEEGERFRIVKKQKAIDEKIESENE
jgi:hypothetical protein